ncbi:MAG: IS66 family transposase zinc-finger binding domain-containing protein [Xanthobacteraceae bacterium]
MPIDASSDDLDSLRELVSLLSSERDAALAECKRVTEQNDRLRHLLQQLRRAQFGRKSERLDPEQLQLAIEDLETAVAAEAAEQDKTAPIEEAPKKKRKTNRGSLPAHLPRVHITLAPDSTACPCCHGVMHVIGEETAERLDKIPAQYQVIVTHRPKYGCRSCEGAIVQAPAQERLIKSGIPTENLVADVVVDKYAWHKPLYRQAQIMRLEGLPVDRSEL